MPRKKTELKNTGWVPADQGEPPQDATQGWGAKAGKGNARGPMPWPVREDGTTPGWSDPWGPHMITNEMVVTYMREQMADEWDPQGLDGSKLSYEEARKVAIGRIQKRAQEFRAQASGNRLVTTASLLDREVRCTQCGKASPFGLAGDPHAGRMLCIECHPSPQNHFFGIPAPAEG